MSEFHNRLLKCFGITYLTYSNALSPKDRESYLNIFIDEFVNRFSELSSKYNINKDLNEILNSKITYCSTDILTKYPTITGWINKIGDKYDVGFNPEYTWWYFYKVASDNYRSSYKNSFENKIRDVACHEVSHLIADLLDYNKSSENSGHNDFWKSIYQPLKSSYTDRGVHWTKSGVISDFSTYKFNMDEYEYNLLGGWMISIYALWSRFPSPRDPGLIQLVDNIKYPYELLQGVTNVSIDVLRKYRDTKNINYLAAIEWGICNGIEFKGTIDELISEYTKSIQNQILVNQGFKS